MALLKFGARARKWKRDREGPVGLFRCCGFLGGCLFRCRLFGCSFFGWSLFRGGFLGRWLGGWCCFCRALLTFGLGRRFLGGCTRLGLALFELEADLAVFSAHQEGLEWPAGTLRDEAWQQVGLAFVEQLGHLFRQDLLLQDDAAGAEVASLWLGYLVFADIGQAHFVYAAAAFRARAERGLSGEVDA